MEGVVALCFDLWPGYDKKEVETGIEIGIRNQRTELLVRRAHHRRASAR